MGVGKISTGRELLKINNKEMNIKNQQFHARIPKDIFAQLKKAAKKLRISMNQLLVLALKRFLEDEK